MQGELYGRDRMLEVRSMHMIQADMDVGSLLGIFWIDIVDSYSMK